MVGRRIVILCDGTSNEIESDRTNVLRLYGALEKDDRQLVFYDPGVGTFGAANAWSYTWRKAHEVFGLATGWGLDHNVKEAYRFLAETYDEGEKAKTRSAKKIPARPADEIYLFGFSRGAYTARVLAGFIHAVGLMRPINLNLLDYAYAAYKSVSDRTENENRDERDPTLNPFAEVRLFERILQPRRPTIRCLGLFDTVGSVIERGRGMPRLRTHAFTRTNKSVEAVRHAVAIDELRTMFQPQLWPAGGDYWGGPFKGETVKEQDVKEVWFSGVHGDVGGGYPEAASKLAKIPLDWMIAETKALGLKYKPDTVGEIVLGTNAHKDYVKPDPLAKPNESMNAVWKLLEYVPRRVKPFRPTERGAFMGWYLPQGERRIIPAGAAIHNSVFKRRGTPSDYDQPNIPDDHTVV
ncbi:T6SS phospholipase effector Tle1-like catalytic domain-containing protein [Hoeflea poritis]|uniref:DUF2235 domain-containing protein n=1 Tax=Hoeflea poritis TaxID=2993659 RepID=A0ABT4VN63_9HYPH|nr:DUF2235 domain-containing protein [Hoeflea poritis]MDA4846148.1 DUF2235 domain-containing protein [Hoeflea poritis]